MTNDNLASTAVIKIHVEKCESHHYKNIRTEATPTQDGSIIKRCSICNDSQLVQTIAKPAVYTITKNTYNGKVLKPSVTITDRNGKKLLLMRSSIRKLEKMLVPIRLRLISVVTIREVK